MENENLSLITKNNITKAFECFLLSVLTIILISIAIICIQLVIYMPDFSNSVTIQEETLQAIERLEFAVYQSNQSNQYQPSNITQQIDIYTNDYAVDDEDNLRKRDKHSGIFANTD